jgi:epsilon-lactone hydrolase
MPDAGVDKCKREIDILVEMIRANPFPQALEEARATLDSLGTPVTDDITVEKIEMGSVACQMLTPDSVDKTRLLVYLHGGGYALGSLDSHAGLASEIGKAAGCCVLQVDYRLAPEHKFPAPVEDACAVYSALLEQGYASEKIAFAGDSAGGGLVIATIHTLKEKGFAMPGAAICLSPWIDFEFSGESMQRRKDLDPMLAQESLAPMVEAYMAGQDLRNPAAAPLYADLTDFPPLLIQVGESEVLFSDAERLAENARAADLNVVFELWPEMIHVWHLFYPMLSEGRSAIARIGNFARENTIN